MALNGSLRRALSWAVLGRKTIVNIYIETLLNVADDPSRFAELREPLPMPEWLRGLVGSQPVVHPPAANLKHRGACPVSRPPQRPAAPALKGASDSEALALRRFRELRRRVSTRPYGPFRPLQSRAVVECFAGKGGLSISLRSRGLWTDEGYEAYPSKGEYIASQDLDREEVFLCLLNKIRAGFYSYAHFGLVCTSWGPAGRLSGGSRRVHCIYGAPTSDREHAGNEQAAKVSVLSDALTRNRALWSWENPASSLLWVSAYAQALLDLDPAATFLRLDQCMYGLKPPGGGPREFTKKPTVLFCNFPCTQGLTRRCGGCNKEHQHVYAWGSARVGGKSVNRASAAGAYPRRLCDAISRCVCESLASKG
jgi:hypothetical protein